MRLFELTITSRTIRTVATLLAMVFVHGAWNLACAQLPKELAGCWLTTRALQTTNPQSLSHGQARAFIGRKLNFTPSAARSGDTVLQSPQYDVRRVKASDFADAFTITLKDIGIDGDSAVEVDIYGEKNQLSEFPGNLILLKGKQNILWNWRGVFFEAKRCTAQ